MAFSNNSGQDEIGSPKPLAEINVTPFVDVMLVLLIVFMVSAPLLQQGVKVDLPKTNSPALGEEAKQFVLVVEKNGNLSDIQLLRGIGEGCDEVALQAVENMPNWIAGTKQGKPERVRFVLPVNFSLR